MQKQRPGVFCKKRILTNFAKFTGKHLCQSLFFNKVAGLRSATLLKKEILTQVFSCEFFKISKDTFFTEQLRTTASVDLGRRSWLHLWIYGTKIIHGAATIVELTRIFKSVQQYVNINSFMADAVIIYRNLTLSWWRPLSYRNQFTDFQSKSMDWFLYDNGLRHVELKTTSGFKDRCFMLTLP